MATSSESINATLRLIEFFTIRRSQGDCVVLLLVHPGVNSLGRYYPSTKVNAILLGETSRVRTLSHGDLYAMGGLDMEEVESCDMMDLATFLECVIPVSGQLPSLNMNPQDLPFKPHIAWRCFIGERKHCLFMGLDLRQFRNGFTHRESESPFR